ncbi:pseudouridylate synthase 7 (putative), partial [Elysia marginata]
YVEEPLKLGQLSGNRFTVVLRNVEANKEVVDKALTSLKTAGFINYFGMQRFGTTSVPTHKIGSALLHGDWKKAVDLILMPRDEFPNKAKFQKIWQETGNAKKTLQEVPRYLHEWYRETLKSDGLDIDNMKRPQNFSIDFRLTGVDLANSTIRITNIMPVPSCVLEGKFKAVVLELTLPPSCYATMALREVLKQDTSAAHQTSLNIT